MRETEVIIVIILSFIYHEFFIVSIYCTDEEQPFDDRKTEPRTDWNDQDKIKLLKIFYETDTGVRSHHKRIKDRWDELKGMEMPQTAHNLYVQITNWIMNGEAGRLLTMEERQLRKSEKRSKLNWTREMKENVLKMYHESNPNLWRKSKRIKELWDKQYPEYRNVTAQTLRMQVRDLLSKRGEFYTKVTSLKEDEKLDLLRCYYKCSGYNYGQMKMMRKLFIKKHPQYANITQDSLRHQVLYFRKKNPEIDDRIAREFSALNWLNPSWTPGETSGSRQEETPYIPRFKGYNLHRGSDQYFNQNYYNPWIHDMTGGPSSSDHHTVSDVDRSHQAFDPEHLYAAFPHADTSHQILHSGHTGEHSLQESEQHVLDERQRKSSKGKEPALDLDLHLR